MTVTTTYVSADQLKSSRSLTGNFQDEDVTAALAATSRAIDKICHRRFWLDADNTSVRYYTADQRDWLEIDDLVNLNTVAVDLDGSLTYATPWTANTNFFLEPLNAAADGEPWTSLRVNPNGGSWLPCYRWNQIRGVRVTGQFGWAEVPDAIVQATTIIAGRVLQAARTPSGVMVIGDQAMRIARMDSNIMALLQGYTRHKIAVA